MIQSRGLILEVTPKVTPKSPLSLPGDNGCPFSGQRDREMDQKVHEARVRRMIDRQGYLLEKSRRRDPRAVGYGNYRIVDPTTNTVVAGAGRAGYAMSLDEAEAWATEER
jgi:hypothetical protein